MLRKKQPPPHKQWNILGIDDAPFSFTQKKVLLIGVIMRKNQIEGILSTKIKKDGDDATEKIAQMIKKAHPMVHAVVLDGIAFGGLNVVSLPKLAEKIQLPVLSIMRREPKINAMKKVLKKLKKDQALGFLEEAGPYYPFNDLFFQYAGTTKEQAHTILKQSMQTAKIPEAIRIAHMVGAGIINGSSKGDA